MKPRFTNSAFDAGRNKVTVTFSLLAVLLVFTHRTARASMISEMAISGKVQSIDKKSVDLVQANGVVVKVPRTAVVGGEDVRPGSQITVSLSESQLRVMKIVRLEGKAAADSKKKKSERRRKMMEGKAPTKAADRLQKKRGYKPDEWPD